MKIIAPYGASAVSGSVGSMTFARNASGLYVRGKVKPVNPNSPLQSAARARFSELSADWPLLSSQQRNAWQTYGANTPKFDSLGNAIKVPGRQWYLGANSIRLLAGLPVVEAGPTSFGLIPLSAVTVKITAGDPISVTYNAEDSWATAVGGALLLFVSDAKSPTVNFCKGPYRYAGKIAGAATAPASPQTIATPFVFTAGQRIFWKIVALGADGRMSAETFGNSFCGA